MQSMQKDKWVERGRQLRKTLVNFATAVWFIGTAVVTPVLLAFLAYVLGAGEKNHALESAFYGVILGALFSALLMTCVERKLR